MRNREEDREWYRERIADLTRRVRDVRLEGAQVVFNEVTRCTTEPWVRMGKKKLKTRSRHWNAGLQMQCGPLTKAVLRAKNSGLGTDRELFEAKRKAFQKVNRR